MSQKIRWKLTWIHLNIYSFVLSYCSSSPYQLYIRMGPLPWGKGAERWRLPPRTKIETPLSWKAGNYVIGAKIRFRYWYNYLFSRWIAMSGYKVHANRYNSSRDMLSTVSVLSTPIISFPYLQSTTVPVLCKIPASCVLEDCPNDFFFEIVKTPFS